MSGKYEKYCAGERKVLKDILPLKVPLAVIIEPSSVCNFKCIYCQGNKKMYRNKLLSMSDYVTIIEKLKEFSTDDMVLSFIGQGEPLLNPQLPEFIKIAKTSGLFKTIKVITNGSLLNEKLSIQLIEAGLDSLRISLQGLSAETVKEFCGYSLKYDQFIKQIEFFYKNRQTCKLYVRILDKMLDEEETQEMFAGIYSEICDSYYIERCIDLAVGHEREKGLIDNIMGEKVRLPQICSYPFYQLMINADGEVLACIGDGAKLVIGDALNQNLLDIWMCPEWNDFKQRLIKSPNSIEACQSCISKYCLHKEDNIDSIAEKLYDYYS